MSDIRILAFEPRPPRRAWLASGLQVCTYPGFACSLNGYVRLPPTHPDLLLAEAAEMMPGTPFTYADGREGVNYPRGYDHVGVDVHGSWTYGPDVQGWIGFDTNHGFDEWSTEDRLRFASTPKDLMEIEVHTSYPPFRMRGMTKEWTEEKIEAEIEAAAAVLAERARAAVREFN